MKENDKHIVYFCTLGIDIILLVFLYNNYISSEKDRVYIFLILLIHIIFIYGLYNDIIFIIDVCHIILCVCIFISPILDSFYLKLIHFILLLMIQFLWLYTGYCILMTNNIKGYGSFITIITAIFTTFLGYNLFVYQ